MNESSPRPLARREAARLIEQTACDPDATAASLEQLCRQAANEGFPAVCVNGSRVTQAVHWLEDSEVKVVCAVAFPLGSADADVKRFETEVAIDSGAHIIEVTANCGRLKDGDHAYVLRELRDVVEAAEERPVRLGLNLDLLSSAELETALQLALESRAEALTLAGSGPVEETVQSVRRLRELAGSELVIKVECPQLNLREMGKLIEAGAGRFGLREVEALMGELP